MSRENFVPNQPGMPAVMAGDEAKEEDPVLRAKIGFTFTPKNLHGGKTIPAKKIKTFVDRMAAKIEQNTPLQVLICDFIEQRDKGGKLESLSVEFTVSPAKVLIEEGILPNIARGTLNEKQYDNWYLSGMSLSNSIRQVNLKLKALQQIIADCFPKGLVLTFSEFDTRFGKKGLRLSLPAEQHSNQVHVAAAALREQSIWVDTGISETRKAGGGELCEPRQAFLEASYR